MARKGIATRLTIRDVEIVCVALGLDVAEFIDIAHRMHGGHGKDKAQPRKPNGDFGSFEAEPYANRRPWAG